MKNKHIGVIDRRKTSHNVYINKILLYFSTDKRGQSGAWTGKIAIYDLGCSKIRPTNLEGNSRRQEDVKLP